MKPYATIWQLKQSTHHIYGSYHYRKILNYIMAFSGITSLTGSISFPKECYRTDTNSYKSNVQPGNHLSVIHGWLGGCSPSIKSLCIFHFFPQNNFDEILKFSRGITFLNIIIRMEFKKNTQETSRNFTVPKIKDYQTLWDSSCNVLDEHTNR